MYDIEENPFYKYIQLHKPKIYSRIEAAIPSREPSGHYDLVGDYPKRQGKYIRPGLLLLVCEVLGGDVERAMDVAAAMQLSEDWILIHDDIEDGSLTRRDGDALHLRDDSSVGLALNAGDALHMVQWKALMKAKDVLGYEKVLELFDDMSDFLLVTAEGQYLEMKWTEDNFFVSVQDYYRMVDRKTGSYTIGGPMRLGAICADAGQEVLDDLDRLVVPLGRAFQIHDDWLDIFSEHIGKDFQGDLIEGKRTLLIHRAYELASDDEKAWIKELFGRSRAERKANDEFKTDLLKLFAKYGCKDWVRNLAEENAQRSREIINGLSWLDDTGKKRMNEVVDLVILREV